MLTVPEPRFRPPRACDTPSQSANEAPSGRVTMYANQNAKIAFRPNHRWAMAGTAIRIVNATPDTRYPRWNVVAVMSPTAVPSAKVEITVNQ